MTARHDKSARHAAPRQTRYRPEPVSFARHRKPNRRRLAWHLDTIAGAAVLAVAEGMMRDR